jgi:hypothetical protein
VIAGNFEKFCLVCGVIFELHLMCHGPKSLGDTVIEESLGTDVPATKEEIICRQIEIKQEEIFEPQLVQLIKTKFDTSQLKPAKSKDLIKLSSSVYELFENFH